MRGRRSAGAHAERHAKDARAGLDARAHLRYASDHAATAPASLSRRRAPASIPCDRPSRPATRLRGHGEHDGVLERAKHDDGGAELDQFREHGLLDYGERQREWVGFNIERVDQFDERRGHDGAEARHARARWRRWTADRLRRED
jgi:hypothetical protein